MGPYFLGEWSLLLWFGNFGFLKILSRKGRGKKKKKKKKMSSTDIASARIGEKLLQGWSLFVFDFSFVFVLVLLSQFFFFFLLLLGWEMFVR